MNKIGEFFYVGWVILTFIWNAFIKLLSAIFSNLGYMLATFFLIFILLTPAVKDKDMQAMLHIIQIGIFYILLVSGHIIGKFKSHGDVVDGLFRTLENVKTININVNKDQINVNSEQTDSKNEESSGGCHQENK